MPEHDAMLLPAVARAAIAAALGMPTDKEALPDALMEDGASFVTLHLGGHLRGCIGSLEAVRPLAEDVQANAIAAAFRDFRFMPLSMEEFSEIDISVSVLGHAEPMPIDGEDDAVRRLVPGKDGLILNYQGRRGTFLPQVWQQLPDARAFLAQLKAKTGLPEDFWHPDIRLFRYRVQEYREQGLLHG